MPCEKRESYNNNKMQYSYSAVSSKSAQSYNNKDLIHWKIRKYNYYNDNNI